MPSKKKCVFCKIAAGAIPCQKIYEDSRFLAFLDISPYTEGHTLIIPKKHYRWIWEIPNLEKFFGVVGKIARHYQEKTGQDFVPCLAWGLDVEHAHLHLLPNAQSLTENWPRKTLTKERAQALIEKLALKK